jgi:nucleotide-binding universal stress UspA family protein
MFTKVMWATDGSDAADRALPFAKALAAESGRQMIVAHCEEHTVTGKFAEAAARVHANEDELRAKIERQAAELVRDGISATVEIAKTPAGRVARTIADSAADTGTDVIVVGTRGHGPLEGMLLGSVTQRLLHIASCPVLVVPADRTRN